MTHLSSHLRGINDQLALDLARAQGLDAAEACAANADRKNPPGWQALAFAYLTRWCKERPRSEPFTSEDISDAYAADSNFVQPHDQRAWGAVIKRAIDQGFIVFHDSKGHRRKGHGSRCDRYRATHKRLTEQT